MAGGMGEEGLKDPQVMSQDTHTLRKATTGCNQQAENWRVTALRWSDGAVGNDTDPGARTPEFESWFHYLHQLCVLR